MLPTADTGAPLLPTDPMPSKVLPIIGGGEMGQRVRDTDWSATPLGDFAFWPQSLRSALSLVLNAKGIAALYWGEQQWLLYNDAYGIALGDRHPRAFGRPMPEVLTDLAPVLGPQVADVLRTGEGFAIERLSMVMHRYGRDEETTWTYSFMPVQGEADGFAGVVLLAIEMTEQKAAERQRDAADSQSQKTNAHLVQQVTERTVERDRIWDNSRDLLGVADEKGIWLSISPAWTRLLGWQPDEIIGRTSEWMEHADDRAKTRSEVIDLAAGKTTLEFENRFRTKDGDHRTLSWTAVPENGLLYCIARDVTAEKERNEALSKAEDALRQSQKMEAVGQLTGGVAHDFNNLLTVIKSSTDLLKRTNLSEERRVRYVGAISDTVDRAAKLTGQLLAFARRQALKPEVFDACDSVRALSDMVGTLTGSRIKVTTELSVPPSYVNADPSQFDTALVNLAVNARDAMNGEGGITIAVRTVEALPAVRSHPIRRGFFIAVSLSDTGSGIPDDRIERIFEPFFTTKETGKGTGLGLSQVIGFAKQSGGDVTVDSTVGEGTTFTLYLPQVAAPEQPITAEETEALVDGHGMRVLVVEDNADVGSFAVQSLTDLGYVAALAPDGFTALAEIATAPDRFDVVFSDVMMPGMNGVELGQEIRRLYPDLPVLLTSGYSHVPVPNGTHGFELLRKPYSVEQLSQMLRSTAMWKLGKHA